MKIIGTAGHVDHGKSTLIAALTGTHPDRLKEEQEREMTIELGFGWMTLPDGQEVGIIDVPGHRDFIGNMLAGIGGIDLVILVIAADEGVMPQTREHLAIIDLLQIKKGIIALTKTDLVEDPDWLDMVEADIAQTMVKTCLEGAPIVRISARRKVGLTELVSLVQQRLQDMPGRIDKAKPRLPVDRVFSQQGFGTVVTGTLLDGTFRVGDDIVSIPSGKRGKIRGLQTHRKTEDIAIPGSRTAINISGIHVDEIVRGEVITHPGSYTVTRRLDCHVQILADITAGLKNNTEVKLFIGAAEAIGNCRVLGVDQIGPGQTGFVQIELREYVVAARGDRYILRRPSPSETIGGGQVIDPQPQKRHKRLDHIVMDRLVSMQAGDPTDILLAHAAAFGFTTKKEIAATCGLELSIAEKAFAQTLADGTILQIDQTNTPDSPIISRTSLDRLTNTVLETVQDYHQTYPLKTGMPREELKSKIKVNPKQLAFLISQCELRDDDGIVALPTHTVRYSTAQNALIAKVTSELTANPMNTPSVKDLRLTLGDELYDSLLDSKTLIQVSAEVVFLTTTIQKAVEQVRNAFKDQPFTASEARDLLNSSRKYVLALLEYLDNKGITRRSGDQRTCL